MVRVKDGKVAKQVFVVLDLYLRVKAKMFILKKTFSQWLEEKMREELENG